MEVEKKPPHKVEKKKRRWDEKTWVETAVESRSKEEGASLYVKYRGCGRSESWNVNKKRGRK
ncbi:hypothetical protein YC2023_078317 [Brassica napus]